jgi:hypothetical protein
VALERRFSGLRFPQILLQVKGGMQKGAIAEAAIKGNLVQAFLAIGREEGLMGYWKGNLPQVPSVPCNNLRCPGVLQNCSINRQPLLSLPFYLAAAGHAGGPLQRSAALLL